MDSTALVISSSDTIVTTTDDWFTQFIRSQIIFLFTRCANFSGIVVTGISGSFETVVTEADVGWCADVNLDVSGEADHQSEVGVTGSTSEVRFVNTGTISQWSSVVA